MRKSQEEFQNCTHSITLMVNENIHNLNGVQSIHNFLCKAVKRVQNDCDQHLEKCLNPEDASIISDNHLNQLKEYFLNLAEVVLVKNLTLDDCGNDETNTEFMSVENSADSTSEANDKLMAKDGSRKESRMEERDKSHANYVNDQSNSEDFKNYNKFKVVVEKAPVKYVQDESIHSNDSAVHAQYLSTFSVAILMYSLLM